MGGRTTHIGLIVLANTQGHSAFITNLDKALALALALTTADSEVATTPRAAQVTASGSQEVWSPSQTGGPRQKRGMSSSDFAPQHPHSKSVIFLPLPPPLPPPSEEGALLEASPSSSTSSSRSMHMVLCFTVGVLPILSFATQMGNLASSPSSTDPPLPVPPLFGRTKDGWKLAMVDGCRVQRGSQKMTGRA